MGIVVFTGPTIKASRVRHVLPDALIEPPASQGDIYRAARRNPEAILLIDGYFERIPAVWHKEVLWSLSQGIPVFGASSMGALRAAELRAFGMVGLGEIFESYASGAITDDDEVAIVHGPRELGYPAVSDAMVDIRANLAAALADGAVDRAFADALAREAKAIFYPERTFEAALAALDHSGDMAADIAAFRDWLARKGFSQKTQDAEQAIAQIARMRAAGFPVPDAGFTFAYTEVWNSFLRSFESDPRPEVQSHKTEEVLTELRIDPGLWLNARQAAEARATASAVAGPEPTTQALSAAAEALRRDRGLEDKTDFARWMAENGLDQLGFLALAREEALVARGIESVSDDLTNAMLSWARTTGVFAVLAERARQKSTAVGTSTKSVEVPDDAALLKWFSRTALDGAQGLSPEYYATRVGFATAEAFLQALREEFMFKSAASQ